MSKSKIKIAVDPDLRELVPRYLHQQIGGLPILWTALEAQDFGVLKKLGHNMRGTGGGYGFDHLSELGQVIESGAQQQNLSALKAALRDLEDYFSAIDLVF